MPTPRPSTLRAMDLLLPDRSYNVPLDAKVLLPVLEGMDESVVLSIIEVFELGRDYEMKVVRGRVVRLCSPEESSPPSAKRRTKTKTSASSAQYKLRRALAAIPVYRDFCLTNHRSHSWLSEYLANVEVGIAVRKYSAVDSVRLMPAFAFVECLDFDAIPDTEHAEWIVEHLPQLRPYARVLTENCDWSREYLQELVASDTPPALADGFI